MSMDGYIKSSMDIILQKVIPNDWDSVIILFGDVGTGKSTLATQLCKYLDPEFNVDNIVFSTKDFLNACNTFKNGSAILWDEAIMGAMSESHANKMSLRIRQELTKIRTKNLKFVFCFPYLHMLNMFFIDRAIAGFYVYAKGFDKRGYTLAYNKTMLHRLYIKMKLYQRMGRMPSSAIRKVRPNFYARFTKEFPVDFKEYEKKKLAKEEDTKEDDKNLWKERVIDIMKWAREHPKVNIKEFAKACNIPLNTLYSMT